MNDLKKKYIQIEGWGSIIANFVLFGVKYWAGAVTGSLALIADAWHTLSDSFSSAIVLVGSKISRKPPDDEHPFGHGRIEHFTAIIIGMLLVFVAFSFVVEALAKLRAHEKTVYGTIAWVVTIVSIIAKELMAQFAFWAGRKTKSNILMADGWHHRSDSLSSLVILAGLFIGKYFWWTDAVLSFIVALMIGHASIQILKKEFNSLIGVKPDENLVAAIQKTAGNCSSLPVHLHHIHLHNYGEHTELSCHIKLPPDMSLQEAHVICTRIEKAIGSEFGFEVTIHPEPLA